MGLDTDLLLGFVAFVLLLSRLAALGRLAADRAGMSHGPFDQTPVLRKVGSARTMAALWATATVAFVFRWLEWAPWYWALPLVVVFSWILGRWHEAHTARLVAERTPEARTD